MKKEVTIYELYDILEALVKLPILWERVKTPEDVLNISSKELEDLIYPVGFYKTKARNIKKLSSMLIDEMNGIIPNTVEELIRLPGVGRKTANLVVSVVFNKPAICVDIHVHRIMNHIGYINEKTPEKTELALRKKLPKELWQKTNYLLVQVGQYLANHKTINDPDNILNQYKVI